MGSARLRENSILLLYIAVHQQLWICTKVQKVQVPNGQLIRNLTVLIPDFCQDAIYQLIPYSVQAIRMPARDDLMLSEEQKMYVLSRFHNESKVEDELGQLHAISQQLVNDIGQLRAQNYRSVLNQGVAVWKNYVMSMEAMREPLVSKESHSALIEMLKVLPTREHEYFDLADFLGDLCLIMASANKITATQESAANFFDFVTRLVDGLRYHIMPFLEETGVSGIDLGAELCPKTFLLTRYLQFIAHIITAETAHRRGAGLTRDLFSSPQFLDYLISLFCFFKDHSPIRRLILDLLQLIVLNLNLQDFGAAQLITDLLVDHVSQPHQAQFQGSSLVMSCLRVMIVLARRRLLSIQRREEEQNSLSDTYKAKMEQFNSFGWLMRFAETRDARIRVLTWDLLTELFDYQLLRSHPSIIHQSINTYLKSNELYCVKISVLKFLNQVCEALMKNCEDMADNSDISGIYASRSDQIEQLTVQTLLQTLNRQGLITQIHKILSSKDCPLMFTTLTLQLLQNLTEMDYKKALPVLTQLDYWTFLVELLDIPLLTQIERQESRQILRDLRDHSLLNFADPCQNLDMVYMTLNSILDFLFSAFKRDAQLAALLVKTTKLMQSVFFLLQHTLDNYRQDQKNSGHSAPSLLRLKNKGLLTVFIDKVIKILHVAMLHPQDYSVDLISKFIFQQPLLEDQQRPQPRNWLYLIEMYDIIEQFN